MRLVTLRFTEARKKKSEQKETKLAKVRHLPSEKLFFRTRSLPSLALPRDFKTPIPQYRERQGSVGILPARAARRCTATDVAAEMPLLRRQSPSEPEEVNVASGVVAMGRSDVAAAACAYAECLRYVCANFFGCSVSSYSCHDFRLRWEFLSRARIDASTLFLWRFM